MSKKWYASRTIWVNVLALISSVSIATGVDLGLTEAVQAEIVTGVMAVVNIFLRTITDKPLV